jgi:hypothetical protein
MRLRVVFEGALCLGAVLAVVGGAAIGLLHVAAPDTSLLPQVERGYRAILFGFLFLTLFAVAAALLEALAAAPRPAEAPLPAPALPPASAVPGRPPPSGSRLESLYHEMKVYIDLEMWELALEKANAIVAGFPGSREAELVSKNLNELRWKAEPKFVSLKEPLSEDQQVQLRQKGLAQMYQHVRTYMELEMWELARQKAVAILKNFPDSPEASELVKVFEMIERKAREAAPASARTEA